MSHVTPAGTPDFDSPAFTPTQWRTFFALTSAIVPPTTTTSTDPALIRYAASSASADHVEFRKGIEQLLETRVPASVKKGMGVVLDMLNSRVGCLLLTYSTTPFHEQPLEVREGIIQMWTSPTTYLPFPPIRAFGVGLVSLTKAFWLRRATEDIYPLISFNGGVGRVNAWARDDSWKQKAPQVLEGEERGFYDQWNFIKIDGPMELEADVVIVGSGCGGAVSAKILAEAGLRVIVVEKGTWVPTDQLPLSMGEACERLFEGGLALKTDGGVALLAGSTFGGGGAINWGASLRIPHYVRREWAEDHNLPFFLTPDFNRHLDNVCNRMGVQTPTTHNHRNIAFLSGAQKLGYNASVVPQNASPEHQDPYCSAGCGCPPGARKMGTLHTYLPDAARAGARFITGLHCNSLIFSKDNNKRVVGVSGVFGSEEIPVVIKAREVIVAAGGLNSPALLLNSGLTSPLIGANLHLHPSPPLFAAFPEKRDPAVGSCLTSIIESFDNLDGKGHGVRLETIYMDPGFALPNITSSSGAEYKEDVLKYQQLDGYCVLIRDEQSGRVTVDGAGKPIFHYTVGAKERQWALTGLEALAKIALVEGAEKIWAPVVGFPPWVKKGPCEMGVLDPGFQQWLAKLKAVGLPTVGTIFGSAHQQGSCKMGATPATGVVDPKGRVWGYEGLSLADASILPSASGVNPMITVMAVAEMVAEGLKERLKNAEGA